MAAAEVAFTASSELTPAPGVASAETSSRVTSSAAAPTGVASAPSATARLAACTTASAASTTTGTNSRSRAGHGWRGACQCGHCKPCCESQFARRHTVLLTSVGAPKGHLVVTPTPF